mmetsp:Transcript_9096/g.39994  ORF Transcript_9096/g.39994 Transcript_9096/m.39994 type:complete len:382 (-) Transcript_9096:271-1416(-)
MSNSAVMDGKSARKASGKWRRKKWAPVSFGGRLQFLKWEPVIALVCYALCSITLNVANKAVFSAATFHYPWMTISIQSLMSVVILAGAALISRPFGYDVPLRASPQLVLELLRPSIFFTMFLVSNAYALHYMSLPMLTIFKSFAPLGITVCEAIFKHEGISRSMLFALLLMVMSNAVTITSDVEATLAGYISATCSVITNIAQLFSLRFGISQEWGVTEKAVWGNLLGALLTFPMAIYFGEVDTFKSSFVELSTPFKMLFFGSGVMGCLISFCMYWATSVTRGSYVSFVGASTKIPLVLLGYLIFDTQISVAGWVGISMGLAAGMVFTYVQQEERKDKDDNVSMPSVSSSDDEDSCSQDVSFGLVIDSPQQKTLSPGKQTL